MKKVKKVFKYGTGHVIPDGAIYLYSCVQEIGMGRLVWHYFLVEVEE